MLFLLFGLGVLGCPGGGGGAAACQTRAAASSGDDPPVLASPHPTPPQAACWRALGGASVRPSVRPSLGRQSRSPEEAPLGCPRGRGGASACSAHCPLGEIFPRKAPPHPPLLYIWWLASPNALCPHPAVHSVASPPPHASTPAEKYPALGVPVCRRSIESLPFQWNGGGQTELGGCSSARLVCLRGGSDCGELLLLRRMGPFVIWGGLGFSNILD